MAPSLLCNSCCYPARTERGQNDQKIPSPSVLRQKKQREDVKRMPYDQKNKGGYNIKHAPSGLQTHGCSCTGLVTVHPEAIDAGQSSAPMVGGEVEPNRVDDVAGVPRLYIERLCVALHEVVGELSYRKNLLHTTRMVFLGGFKPSGDLAIFGGTRSVVSHTLHTIHSSKKGHQESTHDAC